MAAGYDELLEATIQHLEELKGRGVRFVPVSPETLSALATSRVQNLGFAPQKHETKVQKPEVGNKAAKPFIATSLVPSTVASSLPREKASSAAAVSPEPKAAAFADLQQRAMACVKCSHLASSKKCRFWCGRR